MSQLSDLRANLAESLRSATGLKVSAFTPSGFTAPIIFLEADDPYVEPGDSYGSSQINLKIWLVSDTKENEKVTDFLDDVIGKCINAVAGQWTYSVSPPGPTVFMGNTNYAACYIAVSQIIDRTN